jgi:hypothetical protein
MKGSGAGSSVFEKIGSIPLAGAVISKSAVKGQERIMSLTPKDARLVILLRAPSEQKCNEWAAVCQHFVKLLTQDQEKLGKLSLSVPILTNSEDTLSSGPGVIREGYLMKEGDINSSFKERYFVLYQKKLVYFKKQKHELQKRAGEVDKSAGEIDLSAGAVVKRIKGDQNIFTVAPTGSKRSYVLSAVRFF